MTVVRDFALRAGLELDGALSRRLDEVSHHAAVGERSDENALDEVEHFLVAEAHITRQLPGEMLHRHQRAVSLKCSRYDLLVKVRTYVELIPFVREASHLDLRGRHRTDVPRDVIAPARRLDPVHAATANPNQVAGFLRKLVVRNVFPLEVRDVRPPRAFQEIKIVPKV